MCTLALHHLDGLIPVFREVRRVMGSGNFVIFTATRQQMRGYWLNEYFPEGMAKSILQMPALDLVQRSLNEAGFTAVPAPAVTSRGGGVIASSAGDVQVCSVRCDFQVGQQPAGYVGVCPASRVVIEPNPVVKRHEAPGPRDLAAYLNRLGGQS